jgi:hypothetical protein
VGCSHPFGATLSVKTPEGIFDRLIPDPSGEPSSFPSDAQVREKFIQLAQPIVGSPAEAFADGFATLEQVEDIASLTRMCR